MLLTDYKIWFNILKYKAKPSLVFTEMNSTWAAFGLFDS